MFDSLQNGPITPNPPKNKPQIQTQKLKEKKHETQKCLGLKNRPVSFNKKKVKIYEPLRTPIDSARLKKFKFNSYWFFCCCNSLQKSVIVRVIDYYSHNYWSIIIIIIISITNSNNNNSFITVRTFFMSYYDSHLFLLIYFSYHSMHVGTPKKKYVKKKVRI